MKIYFTLFIIIFPNLIAGEKLLIPMDLKQTNHLKAYGIAYWALTKGLQIEWLLNYRGGSFLCDNLSMIQKEMRIREVYFEDISISNAAKIYSEIGSESSNAEVILLEKAPRIAVYVTPNIKPWDDAVTMALEYSEIKYDKIWDDEVLNGALKNYDWLHLHHEDFTGQHGKFYASQHSSPWYIEQQILYEKKAHELGFKKVSALKREVAHQIRNYIGSGGFLFAMCSATDSYDIALSASEVDICDVVFDGDGVDKNVQSKLNFNETIAFQNFTIDTNPFRYEYSDIDLPQSDPVPMRDASTDYFSLFEFSAKHDPIPTMLTQNHVNLLKGFMGQTTAFNRKTIKPHVLILGERQGSDEVKYLHGNYGRGTFTFYAGHDPEDYQHAIGDPPTDLNLHKNSPGYRIILNNILFPAAKKKQQKT
ncbi:MAG: asparagine synthetase B [Bacteroidetes bacterium]|nr:asparagine synthetase B [Bacteroidota bacterium]